MSEHDEIRQMLAGLQGLPWGFRKVTDPTITHLIEDADGHTVAEITYCDSPTIDESDFRASIRDANAKIIAAAPELVGKLLDECEELRARLEHERRQSDEARETAQNIIDFLGAKADRHLAERDEARAAVEKVRAILKQARAAAENGDRDAWHVETWLPDLTAAVMLQPDAEKALAIAGFTIKTDETMPMDEIRIKSSGEITTLKLSQGDEDAKSESRG